MKRKHIEIMLKGGNPASRGDMFTDHEAVIVSSGQSIPADDSKFVELTQPDANPLDHKAVETLLVCDVCRDTLENGLGWNIWFECNLCRAKLCVVCCKGSKSQVDSGEERNACAKCVAAHPENFVDWLEL